MSHLYSIKIKHYRGIENLEAKFGNTKFVAIIGRGDSGKTTILKAIAAVLSPSWNMSFSDWDFYGGDTSVPIVIEAVVKDLPDELLTQNKFGLCLGLLKADGTLNYNLEDIPLEEQDGYEKVLTIRLTVTDNLEPKWHVVHGPALDQETEIGGTDRARLKMFQVSDYIDNHFSYSKGSPLFSLLRQNIEDKKAPEKKILGMVRKAFATIKEDNAFGDFDEVKTYILKLAKSVGLTITDLQTLLEFKENAYSESNITLHSNNIPYRLHGKGSKRLLSIAIQRGLVAEGGIVLIDELEQGMEPDRSRNLARLLKQTDKGQVFVTTHSRAVLAEVSARNLFLMKKDAEQLVSFGDDYQDILRAKPEAFFAKKVVCCEGKTEFGIIRAFDDHLQEKRGYSLAVEGIVYVNCRGGDAFYNDAVKLKDISLEACVFADDDTDQIEKKKKFALEQGIKAVLCEKGKNIEKMLFTYLPWNAVCEMISRAIEFKKQVVLEKLGYKEVANIEAITDEQERQKVRESCMKLSADDKWYKDIDAGEAVGKIWFDHIAEVEAKCGLRKEYDELMDWIGHDVD